jgi:hypothetical protein
MTTGKAVSQESLQRLRSEIALLRQEIEQAQRDRAASQVQSVSAAEVAQVPGFYLTKVSRLVV